MRPTTALMVKDLRVTARAPLFALISVLVPVVFTVLYAIVIHVSTTATIAVADEDHSPQSQALVQVMRDMHNDDGPYYEILTTDAPSAREMYDNGQVGALLTIPAGFGHQSRSGAGRVELQLVNINADGTKNQHIRLEEALRQFNTNRPDTHALKITESTQLDHDIPVTVYLGSALMVFAALYAGMVNAGVAVAREWEDRTAKTLVMSPSGAGALIAGKWLATVATSAVTLAVAGAGIAGVLGYPVWKIGPLSLLSLTVAWIYGAAIGTLLGAILRKSLPLVPVAVILAVSHFLVCGYESYIRGFAHGGVIESLWRSTHWIPLSGLFDAVRFEVAGLPQPSGLATDLTASLLTAVVLAAAASWRLTRTMTYSQGQ